MGALQRFLAILVADFRERSRSTRFWIVLVVTGIVTWWCFPPLDAGHVTVSIGAGMRAHYSSAWIGMVLGLMYSTMLSLIGFYLVRGTLVRDFDTRVWQLLVATPMTRPGYLLAKWSSHLLVFSLIMAIGLLIGVVAQIWRGEDRQIDLIEMVKPVLWLSLPALSITALLAVAFDLLPWLRRTGGNVLYFFVWSTMLAVAVALIDPEKSAWARETWLSDPNGIALAMRDLMRHLADLGSDKLTGGLTIGSSVIKGTPELFEWTQWTPRWSDLAGRLLWPLVSMLAVVSMAPLLDWAAARTSARPASAANHGGRKLRWLDVMLSPLDRHPLGTLFSAELKLVLRQRAVWWWLALFVLAAIQLFAPLQAVAIACIGAWLISTDVLARGVLRERESGTGSLIYSAADARLRLLFVRTLTALALTFVPVLPALFRLLIAQPQMAFALSLIALSIAIAGLAIGVLCRNSRPFELLLVLFAYVGVQGQVTLNAVINPAATIAEHLLVLPVVSVLLLVLWPRHARLH